MMRSLLPVKFYLRQLLIQTKGNVGKHIFFDFMFRKMGAAVTVKLIAAAIFNIDAFSAAFQLMFFSVAGIIIAAPGAFNQRAK